MRTGMNPLAETILPRAPGIVYAVITHLPNRKGYHEHRFEVIQESLESLGRAHPLYIWDNGSDAAFRNWLVKVVKPEYLMLSPNIGKASARTAILRTFPSETIVCMSDDDIIFSGDWLGAQLELLRGFPNVGAVSACPIRTQFRWGIKSTLKWARENATLKSGRFISDEYEFDFCQSIGRDYLFHLEDTANDLDYLIEYNGMQAYATAHHMQFIGVTGRLGGIGLWANRAMRVEQTFDTAIDELGMLRLTTVNRYARHMGNVMEVEHA